MKYTWNCLTKTFLTDMAIIAVIVSSKINFTAVFLQLFSFKVP